MKNCCYMSENISELNVGSLRVCVCLFVSFFFLSFFDSLGIDGVFLSEYAWSSTCRHDCAAVGQQ
jgi:hypothetical protein